MSLRGNVVHPIDDFSNFLHETNMSLSSNRSRWNRIRLDSLKSRVITKFHKRRDRFKSMSGLEDMEKYLLSCYLWPMTFDQYLHGNRIESGYWFDQKLDWPR